MSQETRVCPVCTDGQITAKSFGQKVKVTCTVCAGNVMVPADHPIFQKMQSVSQSSNAG